MEGLDHEAAIARLEVDVAQEAAKCHAAAGVEAVQHPPVLAFAG